MPIKREYDPSLGVIVSSWTGPISAEEMVMSWAELAEIAERTGCRRFLSDVRGVTANAPLARGDGRVPRLSEVAPSLGAVAVAMVVDTEVQLDIARRFMAVVDIGHWEVVRGDWDRALNWLLAQPIQAPEE